MLLEQIHDPSDVRKLNDEQARLLCRELRTFLLEQVSRTGGHLASNLGVVELTVAIHRVFDTSQDRLVFDVGHQCYVHKALTGRRELFGTLRQLDASITKERHLSFFVFNIQDIQGKDLSTHQEAYEFLEDCGVAVIAHRFV